MIFLGIDGLHTLLSQLLHEDDLSIAKLILTFIFFLDVDFGFHVISW